MQIQDKRMWSLFFKTKIYVRENCHSLPTNYRVLSSYVKQSFKQRYQYNEHMLIDMITKGKKTEVTQEA